MNKFFKITVVAAITLTVTGVFAAPPHKKHTPPKHKGNSGIRTATDIVKLVDASVRLLTGAPKTVVVANNTTTAVTVPATTVTVTQPQETVVVNTTAPTVQNNTVIINTKNSRPVMRPVAKPVRYRYGRPRTIKVKHNFAAQPRYKF